MNLLSEGIVEKIDITVGVLTYKRMLNVRILVDELVSQSAFAGLKIKIVILDVGNQFEPSSFVGIETVKLLNIPQESSDNIYLKINKNFFRLFSECFKYSERCIFLDDDLGVRQDFLIFFDSMFDRFGDSVDFRGIVGFSGFESEEDDYSKVSTVKFGYGNGFGFNKKIWTFVESIYFLSDSVFFDAWLERFCRSGFTVMPLVSRVLDFGVDEFASNTVGPSASAVAKSIERSFEGSSRLLGRDSVVEVVNDMSYNWVPAIGRYKGIGWSLVLVRWMYRLKRLVHECKSLK